MGTRTEFLELYKPDKSEFYDVDRDQNENFEKIDGKLKELDGKTTKAENDKQDKHDTGLRTSSKNVVGAINELKDTLAEKSELEQFNRKATYTTLGMVKVGSGLAIDSEGRLSHNTGQGLTHIPSGGSEGKVLTWENSGVARWGDLTIDNIGGDKNTAFNRDFGTEENTVLEGKRLAQILGIPYGGDIRNSGLKEVGVAYYDAEKKKIFTCIEENNLTYGDDDKFIAISNNDLLGYFRPPEVKTLWEGEVGLPHERIELSESYTNYDFLYISGRVKSYSEPSDANTIILTSEANRGFVIRIGDRVVRVRNKSETLFIVDSTTDGGNWRVDKITKIQGIRFNTIGRQNLQTTRDIPIKKNGNVWEGRAKTKATLIGWNGSFSQTLNVPTNYRQTDESTYNSTKESLKVIESPEFKVILLENDEEIYSKTYKIEGTGKVEVDFSNTLERVKEFEKAGNIRYEIKIEILQPNYTVRSVKKRKESETTHESHEGGSSYTTYTYYTSTYNRTFFKLTQKHFKDLSITASTN